MPHNDCGVFGPGCQFGAIVGKLTKPDFVAVFRENLLSVAGELLSEDTDHREAS